ncbi:MAG: hypothetical protein ACPGLY_27910 [Rubripirellula sp.]
MKTIVADRLMAVIRCWTPGTHFGLGNSQEEAIADAQRRATKTHTAFMSAGLKYFRLGV